MIQKVGHYLFLESFDLPFELQIVAGIGEIEALVAQRKIGDAVFPYGDGQPLPVVKRRVFDLN